MVATINYIIELLGNALVILFKLLPDSPFTYIAEIDNTLLNAINWLFPIEMMISHLSLFVVAVALYYVIRIPLRWIKAAGG